VCPLFRNIQQYEDVSDFLHGLSKAGLALRGFMSSNEGGELICSWGPSAIFKIRLGCVQTGGLNAEVWHTPILITE